MSELPQIDPVKILQKSVAKLEQEVNDARTRESHLEALAEAIRDERDEYKSQRDEISAQLEELKAAANREPVQKITEL